MINVTKPFLPPLEEYNNYVNDIWGRNWLTNNGPLVNKLESALKDYLELENLLFVTNGTIALQLAIKALDLKGEIITTPFSYVATTSSIVWESCKPIFVDIIPDTYNIDPGKIERAITPNTSAILATHVFGNPCDIEAIEEVAKRNDLKVIYDAAHCFGTKYKGKSVFEYGDISVTSFHATKLFHTTEGGAIMTRSKDLNKKLTYLRNFGHDGPEKFNGVGINAKNSEFHAAMGLCNLNYVDDILRSRKEQSEYYDKVLSGLGYKKMTLEKDSDFNYAYYPLLFPNEELLLECIKALNKNLIYPRRYFYPSLNKLEYVDKIKLSRSEDISERILCLPLYYELTKDEIDMIGDIICSIK
ncbi:DegT/DnrJ/EryC1/StrS family aminotransferase [Aquimarina latercula]|uniref:DegT/DnrJ/EryC1/StrS family aminotransferase n=1 Tax=Aquimarina latercula TaxID=987 RepID=UPI00040A611E|nr:DegT/DnrJ/EryC1/StrS family aminotransferase [Aquimarina latercula]